MICRRRSCRRSEVRALAKCLALCCTVAALSGCDKAARGDDFFPLDEGLSWTYRVSTTLDGQEPRVEMLTLSNRGSLSMGGQPAMRRHSDAGIDYWLRSDATGIYRIASRNPLDRYAVADEPERPVLLRPYAIGTQWQSLTTAYLLQRRSEVPKEIRRTHKPFSMVYAIDAVDQRVEVPAGRFEHCMAVTGKATVRVYVDAQFAWRDIGLFTREWYCPGVGLVRVERDEQSPSRFMIGGKVTLELTRFQ